MNEKNMLDAFAIITDAGDASAKFLEALKATQECDFEKSAALIEEGRESLVKAHQKQTVMLQQEASGEETEMSLIMVHAQDHLMNAILLQDITKNFDQMSQRLAKLEKNSEQSGS